MREVDLASMRAAEGARVVAHDDRYWYMTHPGFFEPVHLLARMHACEARRPSPLCWGYRAALCEDDASCADSVLPLYMLPDAPAFSECTLSRNRRCDLRKCRREVDLRVLRGPELLLEQGHGVFMSAVRRLGYWTPVSEAEYRRRIERRFAHGRRQVVAGLVDGRLAGYLDAFVVDGILYPEQIFIASEALRTGIGTGLYVATIESALRSGTVREVCNGLHTPEDPNLCHFKESLGFHVVRFPAHSAIPAPIRAIVRRRRPGTYYHLTGELPGAHEEALGSVTAARR
jgi:hypothetical protein